MNSNERYLHENTSTYQFQPIDRSCSSSQINNSHLIQRPVPISSTPKTTSQQYKRNSTINIDTTIRSYGLPRSVTSDHLSNNRPNRLYYYPSVQDVLDALNHRSFEKESFV